MLHDKVGITDSIQLILNGKVIEQKPKPKLICPECQANRLAEPCRRNNHIDCPIKAIAQ